MDALEKEPPNSVFKIPSIPESASDNMVGSTPGNTTNEPSLKITKNPSVARIRFLSSSIAKMFFMVVMNFFML